MKQRGYGAGRLLCRSDHRDREANDKAFAMQRSGRNVWQSRESRWYKALEME